MIVDVFLFNDEFDMLDCRLHQLRGVVDQFVAIEGNQTLAGDPKPYRLMERWRMDKYPDVMVVEANLDDLSGAPPQQQNTWVKPGFEDHWKRDWVQRNSVNEWVRHLLGDTIIMYGDIDELPRREMVEGFDGPPSRLIMQLLVYSTTWTGGDGWTGTVIGRKADLSSFADERRRRDHNAPIAYAGWHMTWFGGEEAVVAKVKMFAHGEMAEDLDEVRRRYREHIRPGDGSNLVPYVGDLPSWVEEGHAPSVWTDG